MSFNLATILEASAAARPDLPMLYFRSEPVTFGVVDDRSDRVAAALMGRGLQRGDRVVIQLTNRPEFVYVYFGILKAGLVAVPINPMLTEREITYVLEDSSARVLLTDSAVAAHALSAAEHASGVTAIDLAGESCAKSPLLHHERLASSATTEPGDTAVLLYTSGTTGKPKGAELTHFQMYMNCTVFGELIKVRDDDVMTCVLPLFHVFGLSTVLNVAVRFGISVVLLEKFDAGDVLNSISDHRATVFAGVPTMYIALLQRLTDDTDVSSLRLGLSGGAALPAEVLRNIESQFTGLLMLEGYGLSETASVASFNIDRRQRKTGSIGKPVWGVELRIVGPEGNDLPPGCENVGELVIRGHNVMKGYLGKPDATAAAVRDGWFHTGDLGYRDCDGYIFIVDRVKDLIIRAGYNVYPREIEEVLYTYPLVGEAAVIGAADERVGEEIVAYVAPKPGAVLDTALLDEYCRKQLAGYKCPRRFHVLPSLPKGATGKILRRVLRDQ